MLDDAEIHARKIMMGHDHCSFACITLLRCECVCMCMCKQGEVHSWVHSSMTTETDASLVEGVVLLRARPVKNLKKSFFLNSLPLDW